MHRFSRVALFVSLALGAQLLSVGPAYAERTVAVTPDSGLIELQTVTVTGDGYAPGAAIFICQGFELETDPGNGFCPQELIEPGAFPAHASSSGELSATYQVRRFVWRDDALVDCAVSDCKLLVDDFYAEEGRLRVFVPLSFAQSPPPPATLGSVTITPTAPVANTEVTVNGSGFRVNATIEVLQCTTAPHDPTDCNYADFVTATADSNGAFSAQFTARQLVIPPGRAGVDCHTQGACVIAAAEVVDVPGTIVSTALPVTRAAQPDARLRRLSDGVIFGDNNYNLFGNDQTIVRKVPAGEKWSFALQLQNDGEVTDDFTIRDSAPTPAGFRVKYFVGYYDVTAAVQGAGFTFNNVAPQEIRKFAIQLAIDPSTLTGERIEKRIRYSSSASPPLEDLYVVGLNTA